MDANDPGQEHDPTLPRGAPSRHSKSGQPPASTKESSSAAEPPRPSSPDPLIGMILGGSRIQSLIGRGAMGAVYVGVQISLDRTVAIKVINPEYCNDPEAEQRFLKEAQNTGRFESPHVVKIHGVGFDQGWHYLVLEYVSGGNLKDYVARQPGHKLALTEAICWLAQASEALLEAEQLELVHRDIKPANLLIDRGSRLKIADFGIAKSLNTSASFTAPGIFVGTPLFASPEQSRGEPLDHRSDMYSLGATFAELLTGTAPFRGSRSEIERAKLKRENIDPRELAGGENLPENLCRVIARMTAREVERRFSSFAEVRAELIRIDPRAASGALSTPDPKPPSNARDAGVEPSAQPQLEGVPQVALLERYDILGELGAGGMGRVYKGRDRTTRELVAIKRLRSLTIADARAIEWWSRECRSLRKLRHRNIVQFLEHGRDAEGPWIAMQLVGDGRTLRDKVLRDGYLSEDEALVLASQMGEALSFAHNLQTLHRDVKPQNILIAADNSYLLSDFGLAREGLWEQHSTTGTVVGTSEYAAPEQIYRTAKVDQRADIYAFAKTLYFALTQDIPSTVREHKVPPRFRNAIMRALEERPEHRFFTIDEFVAALRGGSTLRDSPPAPPPAEVIPKLKTQAKQAEERADWRGAIQTYTAILQQHPDDETSQRALERVLDRKRTDEALWVKIEKAEKDGDRAGAIRLCRELVGTNPAHKAAVKLKELLRLEQEAAELERKRQIDAVELKLRAAVAKGRLGDAKALLGELAKQDRERAAKWSPVVLRVERRAGARKILEKAEESFASGDLDELLAAVERARKTSEDDATAREAAQLLAELDEHLEEIHARIEILLEQQRPQIARQMLLKTPEAARARHAGLRTIGTRIDAAIRQLRARARTITIVSLIGLVLAAIGARLGWERMKAHDLGDALRELDQFVASADRPSDPGPEPAAAPTNSDFDQLIADLGGQFTAFNARWRVLPAREMDRASKVLEEKNALKTWVSLPRWIKHPSPQELADQGLKEIARHVETLRAIALLDLAPLSDEEPVIAKGVEPPDAVKPSEAIARGRAAARALQALLQAHHELTLRRLAALFPADATSTKPDAIRGFEPWLAAFWQTWNGCDAETNGGLVKALREQVDAVATALAANPVVRVDEERAALRRSIDTLRNAARQLAGHPTKVDEQLDAAEKWIEHLKLFSSIRPPPNPIPDPLTSEALDGFVIEVDKLAAIPLTTQDPTLDDLRSRWRAAERSAIETILSAPAAKLHLLPNAVHLLKDLIGQTATVGDLCEAAERSFDDEPGTAWDDLNEVARPALAAIAELRDVAASHRTQRSQPDAIKKWLETETRWNAFNERLSRGTVAAASGAAEIEQRIKELATVGSFDQTHREKSWKSELGPWSNAHFEQIGKLNDQFLKELAQEQLEEAGAAAGELRRRLQGLIDAWNETPFLEEARRLRNKIDDALWSSAVEQSGSDVVELDDAKVVSQRRRRVELLRDAAAPDHMASVAGDHVRAGLRLIDFHEKWLREVENVGWRSQQPFVVLARPIDLFVAAQSDWQQTYSRRLVEIAGKLAGQLKGCVTKEFQPFQLNSYADMKWVIQDLEHHQDNLDGLLKALAKLKDLPEAGAAGIIASEDDRIRQALPHLDAEIKFLKVLDESKKSVVPKAGEKYFGWRRTRTQIARFESEFGSERVAECDRQLAPFEQEREKVAQEWRTLSARIDAALAHGAPLSSFAPKDGVAIDSLVLLEENVGKLDRTYFEDRSEIEKSEATLKTEIETRQHCVDAFTRLHAEADAAARNRPAAPGAQ